MSIRPADPNDEAFILGLVGRFSAFELPAGRERAAVDQAIGRISSAICTTGRTVRISS